MPIPDYRQWQSDLETALKTILRLKQHVDRVEADNQRKDTEIARLGAQLETVRDLLEYRTGQYNTLSEELERQEWGDMLLHNSVNAQSHAKLWALAWKRAAKRHRGRNAFFEDAAWKTLAELARLRKLQPCGHPQSAIVVGEARGYDNYVHHCGWCADVARYREALGLIYMDYIRTGIWPFSGEALELTRVICGEATE